MNPDDEKPQPLVHKLSGLALIILGFLLMAAGYRYGQGWYLVVGIVFLIAGAFLLARKIAQRNRRYSN